jgi:uncharacterized SAM-binding protein YcdF (DUF218 family)
LKLRSWPSKAKILAIIGIIVFGVVAGQIWSAFDLIDASPVQSWEVLEGADCAVVLTGGRGRLSFGLKLLRKNQIRELIVSGVNSETQLVDLISWQDELMNIGLKNLHLERHSRTTFGNAEQSWPILEALNCNSVYLVTSQIHMPRAMKTFLAKKPAGITLVAISSPAPIQERTFLAKLWESIKYVLYSYWAF